MKKSLKEKREIAKKYQDKYREDHKEDRKEYKKQLKIKALNSLGGCICVFCGETKLEYLTIDHKNNDGKKWRISRDKKY